MRLHRRILIFTLLFASVTDACNPRHHYRHVMTEEGKQPIFYPVDDYSSCCPPADQRISHVQVTNVTISTSTGGGSQWLPEYTFGLSIASVKNNQIELNVTMLQRGHIVQIEVEYQYNCSCDDTNVCVSYCKLQCRKPQSSYICVCTVGPIGYKYRQRLTVDVRTYGLQLEVDCASCTQNDNTSTMTCKDSSIKIRCSSGLKDASDTWMYFKNHEKNRTAYCRPNQQREESHHGWILHRETDNFDCVLEIPQCDIEDAGDYQCEFALPNQDTWVQSETRSIAVQSVGPQHGGTAWPTEAIVLTTVFGAILGALVVLGILVLPIIRARRAAGAPVPNRPVRRNSLIEGADPQDEALEQPLFPGGEQPYRQGDYGSAGGVGPMQIQYMPGPGQFFYNPEGRTPGDLVESLSDSSYKSANGGQNSGGERRNDELRNDELRTDDQAHLVQSETTPQQAPDDIFSDASQFLC